MTDSVRPRPAFASHAVATLPPTVALRQVNGHTVPYAYGRPLPGFDRQRHRDTQDLGGLWRGERMALDHALSLTDRCRALAAIEAEGGGRHLPDYDDSQWPRRRIPLPENRLSVGAPSVAEHYEDGVWYRRTIELPTIEEDTRLRLNFLAVNYIADVWVNGHWAGYHEGGYSPFSLDVTDWLVAGRNVLAVRVDNPPWESRTDIVPAVAGDWWNYTGIIQEVYLESLPMASIARVDVVPSVDEVDPDSRAQLAVTVVLDTDGAIPGCGLTVRLRLFEAEVDDSRLDTAHAADLIGEPVPLAVSGNDVVTTRDGVVHLLAVLQRPRLWTPETPHLYVLVAELTGRDGVLDSYSTQIGVRAVGLAARQPAVLLNGRAASFRGVARHEDWADSGRTVSSPRRVVADLVDIRGLGATLLRTAHYPNHPLTYLVADRVGLAVLEEIPTWWFETYHFADQELRGIALQMWREMIFRDYNRPSVLFWSAASEAVSVQHRARFLNRLVRELRLRYDDGRLVTQSAAPNRPGPEDPTQRQVDVAGWTSYFGVLDDHAGQEAEFTRRFLDAAQQHHPGRPILITEFGMWADEDDCLAQRQREVFEHTWPVFRDRRPGGAAEVLAGCVWWTAYDWRTHLNGLNTFGLSRMDRMTGRPVRRALATAFRSTPSQSGPVLARRKPAPPAEITVRSGRTPGEEVLADFVVEDSLYSVRDVRADRIPLSDASGAWAMRMIPQGSRPTVGMYLYRRPVTLAPHEELRVRLLDPTGGRRLLLRLQDAVGIGEGVELLRATAVGRWTETRVTVTRFRNVDLSTVERAELIIAEVNGSLGRPLYVDTLLRFPRSSHNRCPQG